MALRGAVALAGACAWLEAAVRVHRAQHMFLCGLGLVRVPHALGHGGRLRLRREWPQVCCQRSDGHPTSATLHRTDELGARLSNGMSRGDGAGV